MRRILFIVAVAVVPLLHGCVLFSNTEVVRPNEVERAVTFESKDAEDVFREAVRKHPSEVDRTQVGNEWFSLYESTRQWSDAARFNRTVAGCDRNGDRVITFAEVVRYSERSR